MIHYLEGAQAKQLQHGEIESYIDEEGTEVLRCLLQGFLDMKAAEEPEKEVYTQTGAHLSHKKPYCKRNLESLFGQVEVHRTGYSKRHCPKEFPMDTELTLSKDKYSDGLRLRLATEAIPGSYDDAVAAIARTTGGCIPKRQALQITQDVAQDFDAHYLQQRYLQPEETSDLLVLTTDGKGIVMRSDSLRACTQKAAEK